MSLPVAFMYAAIVLDQAHLACPIALAWGSPRFRAHMLAQPDKFMLLPALLVVIPVAIGGASISTDEPAFRALAATYGVANLYHFSTQNYGICALSGGMPWQRNAAFALTAIVMLALPVLWGPVLWIVLADFGISLMHWIMDLRLSGYAAPRPLLFTAAMLVIGGSGLIWKTVASGPRLCGPLLACTMVWSIPNLLALRYGLGFWHFLMSRWVWSREGRELLA